MHKKLAELLKYRKQFLDLLVGVPNYERYVEHMKLNHPEGKVKTRKEFFIEAQNAKYSSEGGRVSRCC
jgi:uncharacterized short protein YbdD (DUF466 family)